jgi:subtilisin-like proprotein convertase family protein
MPEVKFGKKDEPSVTLQKSDDLIAVRTRSTRSVMAGPVMSPAAAELRDGQLVLAFPEAGVEVYRLPVERGRKSLEERKQALRMVPDVRFAGGVLADEQTGEPVIYTENLFIKFVDQADPDHCRAVIREAGLTIKEELNYAPNAFFVAAPEGTGTAVFDIALSLLNREDVEYCHPEVVRRRKLRVISAQQWHLKSTTIGSTLIAASANVEAAHQITRGAGVTVAVIDDGIDIDHLEFGTPGKIVAPRDATTGSNDPRPKDLHPQFPENHGTACAGVACADGGHGASGVAPGAKLLPIRLASGLGSQQEANAFRWAADNGADVISCSWGPADGDWFNVNDPLHNQIVPLPASTKLAIDYATTNGRGGKGCVVLFAAGNGNESVDNDGYASYEQVIAVAACNDRSQRSVYSDFGQAIWCAFPSSDMGHQPFSHPEPLTPGIWTTDRVGPRGYNPGNQQRGDAAGHYTNSFGGTSSACPGAAGVAALVLSANPALRWQEVRDILSRSCDKIDPQGGEYDANGWSKYYGYGRLNAEAAVKLAQPAPRNSVIIMRNFDQPLPDLHTVSVSLEVGEAQPIDNLAVHLDILHTYIGDLVVTLVPPLGMHTGNVVLHNRSGGPTRNLKRTFDALTTPDLAAFRGKSVQGTWTLQVQDAEVRDEGSLVSYGLELAFSQPVSTRGTDTTGPSRLGRRQQTTAPRRRR